MFIEPLLYISKHKQPFSLLILITHVCGSRDHINIEHAYSGYSLPKRDSIHRPISDYQLELDSALTVQATMAGLLSSFILDVKNELEWIYLLV